MEDGKIVLAYNGVINAELLEGVYSMMNNHLEEKKISSEKKKKFFHLLIEALQNVFHHQTDIPSQLTGNDSATAGFMVKKTDDTTYIIITGNYIMNSGVEELKKRLDKVNSLTAEELKIHYRESLAGNEFSKKGGAGLGIIEMARKSGNKLEYDFHKINEEYSFFSLTILIP